MAISWTVYADGGSARIVLLDSLLLASSVATAEGSSLLLVSVVVYACGGASTSGVAAATGVAAFRAGSLNSVLILSGLDWFAHSQRLSLVP